MKWLEQAAKPSKGLYDFSFLYYLALIGLLIGNYLTDYLSLWKTRFLLTRTDHIMKSISGFGLVILDFLITTALYVTMTSLSLALVYGDLMLGFPMLGQVSSAVLWSALPGAKADGTDSDVLFFFGLTLLTSA